MNSHILGYKKNQDHLGFQIKGKLYWGNNRGDTGALVNKVIGAELPALDWYLNLR